MNSNILGVVTTPPMVAGLDVGGTKTNATLLDSKGVFLNSGMVETPSRVLEGPEAAIEAMAKAIELAIGGAGVHWESVRVIGLDTPGPASANGVISSKGDTEYETSASIRSPAVFSTGNIPDPASTTPSATQSQLFADFSRKYRQQF